MDQLPFEGDADPLTIPARYGELRRERPVARVRTQAGDLAWLVTGYDPLKELYGNRALGLHHPDPDNAPRGSTAVVLGKPPGDVDNEDQQHRMMRKLLTPAFAPRRMETLRVTIGRRVDDMVRSMHRPPADLHAVLSMPLSVMVICDLLGAPSDDHARLRAWSTGIANITDLAAGMTAYVEFADYTKALMDGKRSAPGDDLLTDLAQAVDDGLLDPELAPRLALGLLFAGHETTMNCIDLGLLLLFRNPGQLEKLRADPTLLPGAVEEILRMTVTPGKVGGVVRYAATDIAVGDTKVEAGDAVLMSNGAANRDAAVFDRPDEFDITRAPNPHLSFGHGPRFCMGASLARIELHEVFGRLLERFPGLRLAVPHDEVPVNADNIGGGLAALPITW